MSTSFRFSHAITRKPAASVVDGLRAVDTGTPDFKQMLQDQYLRQLAAKSEKEVSSC